MTPAPPDKLRRKLLAAGLWLAVGAPFARPAHAADGSRSASARPPLLLATLAPAEFDLRAYLTSEKFDGVRAFWDGRSLRFRSGRPITAPAWFIAQLPAQPLDGELWLGRRRFDALSAIVRARQPDDAAWRELRYLVFELPGGTGDFAQRAAQIEAIVRASRSTLLRAVEQTRVADRTALQRRLDAVLRDGGEGLMLHRADSPYLTGRSDALLKLKPALDAEAEVISHRAGRGRHAGRVGALHLRTDDGRRFWLGSGLSDAERSDPPPLGSRVTYRYRELTPAGTPRFASYVRRHVDF